MSEKKKPVIIKKDKKMVIVKESKEQMFIRIAIPRVQKILRSYRILGNCANRNNYAYSQEQVDKISTTLIKALENTIAKFQKSKEAMESFKF